ncbi:MAG: DUF2339 domain-containing protein [Acidobacteria bacterium]|nr:DUF2339 domain-containing protein [Acidobacteriota bacterium]
MNQDQLKTLLDRLDYLEFALREQISRIYALENKLEITRPDISLKQPEPYSAPAPHSIQAEVTAPEFLPEQPMMIEEEDAAAIEPQPLHPPQPPQPPLEVESEEEVSGIIPEKRDLESLIGGTWFNRIGIFAIVLGAGYFLREAFRRGWIGPQGRVMIGIAAGLGLLFAGEKIRSRGYKNYAYGLSGGGISILYLTFFAAYDRYQLISQLMAFLLMSLVTAAAVLLAARYDALVIAIIGLLGGFLTPYMVSSGVDNQSGLFTYIALLDAGVLAVAYFKQWRTLNYLAFIGTIIISGGWMDEYYAPEKLWTTIFFFTLLFLIFAVLAVFHNIVKRKPTIAPDLGLIFSNAGFYFGTSYFLLENKYHPYLGLFAIVMSAFYLGLGYLTYTRDREDKYLIMTFIGLAAIFLTLAIPIQLDQHWVTMSWALEGLVLTWIGLKSRSLQLRAVSAIIFFISFSHWLMFDLAESSFGYNKSFNPIFNKRALSAVILAGSLVIAAILYQKFKEQVELRERQFFLAGLIVVANLVTLIWLSSDVIDLFNKLRMGIPEGDVNAVEYLRDRYNNFEALSLTALWTTFGLSGLIVGVRRRVWGARIGGLLLLGLTILKVLAVDSGHFEDKWHRLILNPTFASFLIVIAAMAVTMRLYFHNENVHKDEHRLVFNGSMILLNVLALIALSAESVSYFQKQIDYAKPYEEQRELSLAKQLTLSVIWTLYGGIMLFFGIRRVNRLLRWMGLGLLAISIVKVFLVDLSSLDTIYRIASIIVLGAMLLAVSFLYQQWQKRTEEEKAGK